MPSTCSSGSAPSATSSPHGSILSRIGAPTSGTSPSASSREGLKDRAVTRNLDWGLPVPAEGYEDRRIYVWFEAVIGYLSASVEWAGLSGDPDAWRPFWQDPATKAYYFMGKDNIPFHTLIWPAILMGYGDRILPYDVPANEFLNLEGRQLSTSRNWAVWAPDYLDRFPADPLRYHLASILPETSDSDFSWADYVRSNNDELVATFGNLVHRTLTPGLPQLRRCDSRPRRPRPRR